MPTPTDDRRDLITVVAYMKAQPGKEQALHDALAALIEPTTKEDGCVNYDLHRGVDDPGVFFFYENWESGEHLDAHLQTPHLVDLVARMDEFLDEDGLTITRLQRVA